MIKSGITRSAAATGIAVVVAMAGVMFSRQVVAQSDQPLVKVVAPESAKVGDADIVVQIQVENVKNLGSFEFLLKYDPDILAVANDAATNLPLIQRGDFLGSSEREVVCDDPVSQAGVLRMVCITLRPEPAGPDGGGTLAEVTFEAVGKGSTELSLDKVQLTDPEATVFDAIQLQNATLSVSGGSSVNWVLWGSIIAVVVVVVLAGGAFAATRARGSGGA
jgi:hypothetical protein